MVSTYVKFVLDSLVTATGKKHCYYISMKPLIKHKIALDSTFCLFKNVLRLIKNLITVQTHAYEELVLHCFRQKNQIHVNFK